jgi:hypothetical protein
MKILIISQHIHPKLSPRSHRTTELALELERQGHEVILYAVLGDFDYLSFTKDKNLQVKNIGPMLFSTADSCGNQRNNIFDKVLRKTLGRLLEFPDIEFVFKTQKIISKEKNIDLLITISYPHPINWGAALSKSISNINSLPKVWVSDCGDPFWGDPINKRKFFYFKYIEEWWSKNTNYITIPTIKAKNGYLNDYHDKIRIIPQGINLNDFRVNNSYIKNKVPTFAYSGAVYPGKRDPRKLLEYLINKGFEFRFIVYTQNVNYFKQFKKDLLDKMEIRGYVERKHLINELSKMDFLINIENPDPVQSPSKLIDYYLAKRPIITIKTDFDDVSKNLFLEFISGNYVGKEKVPDLSEFDIKNIALKFLQLAYEDKRKTNNL